MRLITSSDKDKVLTFFVGKADNERFVVNFDTLQNELDVEPQIVKIILNGFNQENILDVKWMNDAVRIVITYKAHEIISHGGFVAQDEILKANIDKLDMQLQYLAKQIGPDHLDTLAKISSIGSAIISALPLFK